MSGTDIGTDKHRYLQIDTDDADLGKQGAYNLLEFNMQMKVEGKPDNYFNSNCS